MYTWNFNYTLQKTIGILKNTYIYFLNTNCFLNYSYFSRICIVISFKLRTVWKILFQDK